MTPDNEGEGESESENERRQNQRERERRYARRENAKEARTRARARATTKEYKVEPPRRDVPAAATSPRRPPQSTRPCTRAPGIWPASCCGTGGSGATPQEPPRQTTCRTHQGGAPKVGQLFHCGCVPESQRTPSPAPNHARAPWPCASFLEGGA